MRTSSATFPMLEMALSAICSTSFARRLATDKPSGNGDHLSPGEMEHDQVTIGRRLNTELGARRDPVAELSPVTESLNVDVVVS